MTRIPFIVTHAGVSARCGLHVDHKLNVLLIEFASMTTEDQMQAPTARAMLEKIEFLNDMMHADVPFAALASCRRSPGLFGAILDPAADALENLRAALKGSDHAA